MTATSPPLPDPGLHREQSNDLLRQARILQVRGQYAAAAALCEPLLSRAPHDFDLLLLLGALRAQTQQPDQSVDLLCRAIEVRPDSFAAYYALGYAMCQLQQFDAGVECYDKCLLLNPAYAEAACDRGSALVELGRHQAALDNYAHAIALRPGYAEAWSNQGNALLALGQTQAAIASFNHALTLNPQAAATYLNLGNALQAAGEATLALSSYDQALALQPGYLLAMANRCGPLKQLYRLDEAVASCNQALALDPEHADTYWNRGLALLLQGNLRQGFADYHWRWKRAAFAPIKRNFHQPLWLGDTPVRGKTLLLHAEQGLGDSLQFVRYAQALADLGARVVLEAEPALFELFGTLLGVDQLVRQGQPLPAFDMHCPLLSLPLALGTELDSIPAPVPYLHADPERRAQWLERLGPRTGLRVGLVWSGSPTHQDDHNRSISLAGLLSHLPSGPQYVSLQKEVRPSDQAALQTQGLLHFGPQLQSFSDTAAVCACLDLVISVDTSVAHLSGAMGQRTWVLLPYLPDWRWLMHRSDSPWYPSARLYRQTQARDWSAPLSQLALDLQTLPARAGVYPVASAQ